MHSPAPRVGVLVVGLHQIVDDDEIGAMAGNRAADPGGLDVPPAVVVMTALTSILVSGKGRR